ncbi:MAG: hypothetical protein EBU30_12555 [Synechococcaceae bacterium WB6_3B_236]|nr:hypothetical protein [Synechococcaceae bacterium WB6_3B_236]
MSAGNQVSTRSQWLESLLITHANAPLASQGELRQAGLPHGRVEDWRFTDLAPLLALNPAALRPRGGAQTAVASWPAVEQGVVRLMLAADGLTLVAAPGSAPWPAGVELQTEALAPYPLNSEATDLAPRLQAVLPGPQLGINLAAGAKLRLEVLLEPDGADALLAPRLAMGRGPAGAVVADLVYGVCPLLAFGYCPAGQECPLSGGPGAGGLFGGGVAGQQPRATSSR